MLSKKTIIKGSMFMLTIIFVASFLADLAANAIH